VLGVLVDANEPASDRLRLNGLCAWMEAIASGWKYSSGQDPDRRQWSMAFSVDDKPVSGRHGLFDAGSAELAVDGLSDSQRRFCAARSRSNSLLG